MKNPTGNRLTFRKTKNLCRGLPMYRVTVYYPNGESKELGMAYFRGPIVGYVMQNHSLGGDCGHLAGLIWPRLVALDDKYNCAYSAGMPV